MRVSDRHLVVDIDAALHCVCVGVGLCVLASEWVGFSYKVGVTTL